MCIRDRGKDRPAEIQQKMLENRTGYTELRKGIDHVLQKMCIRDRISTLQKQIDDLTSQITEVKDSAEGSENKISTYEDVYKRQRLC